MAFDSAARAYLAAVLAGLYSFSSPSFIHSFLLSFVPSSPLVAKILNNQSRRSRGEVPAYDWSERRTGRRRPSEGVCDVQHDGGEREKRDASAHSFRFVSFALRSQNLVCLVSLAFQVLRVSHSRSFESAPGVRDLPGWFSDSDCATLFSLSAFYSCSYSRVSVSVSVSVCFPRLRGLFCFADRFVVCFSSWSRRLIVGSASFSSSPACPCSRLRTRTRTRVQKRGVVASVFVFVFVPHFLALSHSLFAPFSPSLRFRLCSHSFIHSLPTSLRSSPTYTSSSVYPWPNGYINSDRTYTPFSSFSPLLSFIPPSFTSFPPLCVVRCAFAVSPFLII